MLYCLCDTFPDIFREKLVQQVLLESQEVQDFRECQAREAYQDLQAQRAMQYVKEYH